PALQRRRARVRPAMGHRARERELPSGEAVRLERSAVARGPPCASERRRTRGRRHRAVAPRRGIAPAARRALAATPIVRAVTGTAFTLFFGPGGESAVEAQLDRIRVAIGSGTLRRAAAAGFAPLLAV